LKILHIISSVNPEGGGVIEGIKQLTRPMQDQGHEIEIASLDAADANFVKQAPIPVNALGPGVGSYNYSNKFKLWLDKRCHDYDVFIINGIWQYHSFATHSVLSRKKIPYYLFTHGMLDPWFKYHYPLKHLKKSLYWLWGEYPVLRDAEKVFFTCEEERVLAQQSFWPYRCNEQVVNFGTAGLTDNGNRQCQLFLNQFPQLQGQRFLLFLSRIHPKKGVDLMIEAFAKTCKTQANTHLVIAGPDQTGWQAELQELADQLGITDKIFWVGMLSGDIKWGAYLLSEGLILPSHQENFGIVVAEALSCAKPVLISNKVNIWREIEADGAGFVDDDTVDGTVNNLKKWLDLDSKEYETMCENANNCFHNRFHIQRAADRLLEIIKIRP
jgi:glycosyltransferase involved in cell wall biosynthesis